jgi:hypothetical protein
VHVGEEHQTWAPEENDEQKLIRSNTKTMKKKFTAILFALISTVFLIDCSKSDSKPKPEGNGTFVFQGTTYMGKCSSVKSGNNSSNINVSILGTTSVAIIIYNMPQTSSGTVAFVDGFNNINSATNLYAFVGGKYSTVAGGGMTKTGANTFTFSCQVYYLLEPNTKYTVTGSGTY